MWQSGRGWGRRGFGYGGRSLNWICDNTVVITQVNCCQCRESKSKVSPDFLKSTLIFFMKCFDKSRFLLESVSSQDVEVCTHQRFTNCSSSSLQNVLRLIPAMPSDLKTEKTKFKTELHPMLDGGSLCLRTGFWGRSDSCSTMDLDWLRRSPELCELLMRICTAPWAAGLRCGGWIRGGCFAALWRFVILWMNQQKKSVWIFQTFSCFWLCYKHYYKDSIIIKLWHNTLINI